ncbi:hypothetical protein Efla_001504 [Eimeria flavescens]
MEDPPPRLPQGRPPAILGDKGQPKASSAASAAPTLQVQASQNPLTPTPDELEFTEPDAATPPPAEDTVPASCLGRSPPRPALVVHGTPWEIIVDTGAELSLVSAALLSPSREYKPRLPCRPGTSSPGAAVLGLIAVDYFGELPVQSWAGRPLARAQPVAPSGVHARLAPRASTSLEAAASSLTPSATAARALAHFAEPPSSAASPPGGFRPTLPLPSCCFTKAELAELQLLLDISKDLFNDGSKPLPSTTLLRARLDKARHPPSRQRRAAFIRRCVRVAVAKLDAQGITEPSSASWRTPIVMRQYKRLPFGFGSSPSIFHRMVDMLLGGTNWVFAIGYMDDIIVNSGTRALRARTPPLLLPVSHVSHWLRTGDRELTSFP